MITFYLVIRVSNLKIHQVIVLLPVLHRNCGMRSHLFDIRSASRVSIFQRCKSLGGGGRISCLRLHFHILRVLKNWVSISQTFNLQRYFFFKWCNLSSSFLEWQCGMALFKKKKVERKLVHLLQEKSEFHPALGSCYLTINEWGWVPYEELWRSRRVLSVEAVGRGG